MSASMVKHSRPMLMLALALLVGCAEGSAPAESAAAPASVATPVITAAPETVASAVTAPAASDAAAVEAPRLAQALPTQTSIAQSSIAEGKWQAGRNYTALSPAQPTNAGPGKVEVIEVFWYGCSHCYELDPYLESWAKNKPAYIEFVRLPVIWGPGHKLHGRLFYTLQVLGKLETLHTKVFDTIHRGGNMLIAQDEDATFKMQLAWAEANGVNGEDFKREYNGFAVKTALDRAELLTKRYRVAGVPLMIVNGRYSTDVGAAGGHSQLLTLLNDLAASEKR
jgi:thiol:disulfide interchange protein DsbA